jgi:hypothetical protein
MRTSIAFALLVAFGTLACEGAPVTPVDRRQTTLLIDGPVAPGAIVSVTHVNTSSVGFAVRPCLRELEEERAGTWVSLGQEFRSCMDDLTAVPAGESTTLTTDIPLLVADGTYRLRLRAIATRTPIPDGEYDIVTGPFQIRK